jgi:hypothetical protein
MACSPYGSAPPGRLDDIVDLLNNSLAQPLNLDDELLDTYPHVPFPRERDPLT